MAYVDPAFLKTVHGRKSCVTCHGGDKQSPDKQKAHAGRFAPSSRFDKLCAPCHGKTTRKFQTSLHATFRGAYTVMQTRAAEKWPLVKPVMDQSCFKCHAACGSCHVSRLSPGAKGLYAGHQFLKKPSGKQACNCCHGGRIGPDYYGGVEGNQPDVHWEKFKMECVDCHAAEELHGDGRIYATRQERRTKPSCLDCHPDAAAGKSNLASHNVHGDKLSCQVCHSQAYYNCYACHVGKGSNSEKDFKIGRVPGLPVRYAPMRHVPVTRRIFESKVPEALPQYDSRPSWTPAVPHSVRRLTPQNQTCNHCHGREELFILKTTLDPRYPKANAGVALEKAPKRREQ